MSLIITAILAILVIFAYSFQIAPIYTGQVFVICLIVIAFISTEHWITHDANEFENRFWTFIAFFFSASTLFSIDSPFRFPIERQGISWTIVLLVTFIAHNYERHLQRLFLSKQSNIVRRIKSADFAQENRVNARMAIMEIKKLIESIDLHWMSSTFLNMFFLSKVLAAEKQIIEIFASASANELNLIVCQAKLALILYKVKDHKFAQQFNRSKLLELLAKERVHELNVNSKATLLDALQRLKISAHLKNETYVKNIFENTKGNDLSELKCLTDSKGDVNSMHKLVYNDLRSLSVRDCILNHINKQANTQKAHHLIKSKHSKFLKKFAWMKIISDVDDTLSCSGGSWPKGVDQAYPDKAIYPGVISFYRELDLGTAGDEDEWDLTRLGNLVFLSARPHVYKDVSESFTYHKFCTLQQSRGLHTSPTLLAGSLDAGTRFMVNMDSEPLARKKYESFIEYLTIYPEFNCIFIGDNGQGDVRTSELMAKNERFASNLQRSYIHVVQALEKTYVQDPCYKRPNRRAGTYGGKSEGSHNICFFSTYIDAAIDAYNHKLIRLSGLRRITDESIKDFFMIKDTDWKMDNLADEVYLTESDTKILNRPWKLVMVETNLLKTLEKVSSVTAAPGVGLRKRKNSQVIPQSMTQSEKKSSVKEEASQVGSMQGKELLTQNINELSGKTSSKDTIPDISQPTEDKDKERNPLKSGLVSFPALSLSLASDDKKANSTAVSNPATSNKMKLFSTSQIQCKYGFIKKELRIRELNVSIENANRVLEANRSPPVQQIPYPKRFEIGQSVETVFGTGVIERFRPEDGIYEIKVERLLFTGKRNVMTIYVAGIYLYSL